MFKEILTKEEINQIASEHSLALKYFGDIFNEEKIKNKFRYLSPLKKAGFSLTEAQKFEFKAGEKMWANCTKMIIRKKGGRPKLEQKIVESINEHMKNSSSIAANRYLKKLKKNVRYRDGTYRDAFNSYLLKSKISFSTFKNKICKRYKKPHRISDLCDFCELAKVSLNILF